MPYYSSCASDLDDTKINHVRQNGRQLQLLCTHDSDKTEDGEFIASYLVSSSIRKNDFYTKKKLISQAFFSCIVKAHRITHASSQHAFFSTCITNLILKKELAFYRLILKKEFAG